MSRTMTRAEDLHVTAATIVKDQDQLEGMLISEDKKIAIPMLQWFFVIIVAFVDFECLVENLW
jgi:hypothetical protein